MNSLQSLTLFEPSYREDRKYTINFHLSIGVLQSFTLSCIKYMLLFYGFCLNNAIMSWLPITF